MKTLSIQQTAPYQELDRPEQEGYSLLQQATSMDQNANDTKQQLSKAFRGADIYQVFVADLIIHHSQVLQQIPLEMALQAIQEAWTLSYGPSHPHSRNSINRSF